MTKPVTLINLHYPQILAYFLNNVLSRPSVLLLEDPEHSDSEKNDKHSFLLQAKRHFQQILSHTGSNIA